MSWLTQQTDRQVTRVTAAVLGKLNVCSLTAITLIV